MKHKETNPGLSDLGPVETPQSRVEERKLLARIDLHLMPCICVMYLLSFLDRVNISNAVIMGLREDLHIETGTKYNTALTIFFVPYILFEIPSNILLKKFKPHVWLPLCMFGFGFVLICQGLVQNWGGLMATRWLLGTLETGLVPGSYYLMGMWYTRDQAQKRFSIFFSASTLAGAFGGLLATAIGKMDGMRGYRGWRWIFILEGALTCVIAIACFFLLTDFPEDAKWLTEGERKVVLERLAGDTGKTASHARMGVRDVLSIFKDCKVYFAALMYLGACTGSYGYAYFAPTIINGYGYGVIKTQLYSIPPWVVAFGICMITAYCSDKLRHRYMCVMVPILISLSGYIILFHINDPDRRHVQYAALFLIVGGGYSIAPVLGCWFALNLAGQNRRSVGIAWQVGFGNMGGIIAAYSFLEKDAPEYRNGYIIGISAMSVSAAMATAYFLAVWFDNWRRERAIADGVVDLRELSEQEEEGMGDLAPTYRYFY